MKCSIFFNDEESTEKLEFVLNRRLLLDVEIPLFKEYTLYYFFKVYIFSSWYCTVSECFLWSVLVSDDNERILAESWKTRWLHYCYTCVNNFSRPKTFVITFSIKWWNMMIRFYGIWGCFTFSFGPYSTSSEGGWRTSSRTSPGICPLNLCVDGFWCWTNFIIRLRRMLLN